MNRRSGSREALNLTYHPAPSGILIMILTLTGLTLGSGPGAPPGNQDEVLLQKAREILKEVPLIDGHNDTPWQYRDRAGNHLPDTISQVGKVNAKFLDLESFDITTLESATLTRQLHPEMVALGTLQVVGRGQIDMPLRDQDFQQIGCTSTECAAKVDKLFGAARKEMGIIGNISALSTMLYQNMNKNNIGLIMSGINNKETKRSQNEKIVIANLLALTTVNALWAATSTYHGPYIALIMYALVTYLCWQKDDFRAGVISGTIGLGIHLYELLFMGVGAFAGLEMGYFFMNLVLPIPLIHFSYKAYQKVNKQGQEIGN